MGPFANALDDQFPRSARRAAEVAKQEQPGLGSHLAQAGQGSVCLGFLTNLFVQRDDKSPPLRPALIRP